jgi:hypothetical protein
VPIDPRWPGAWEQLATFFEDALAEGSSNVWDIDDVYTITTNGLATAWGIIEDDEVIGAAVSFERIYPKKKAFEILLFATKRNTEEMWITLLPQVRQMCINAGCSMIAGGGRPGWARKLGARINYNFEIDL